jgi:ABC-2 type transport system ATP-binding protein
MQIEVEALVKNYGSLEAVRNISFSLGQGEILGFLGPNGAGKTTVMRLLAGYHFPNSGTIRIDGFSLEENTREIQRRIGYLSENVPLYGDLTPLEFLNFAAEARSIPRNERARAVEKALSLCGLETRKHQRMETLSRGLRQRAGLSQALLHDPPILILDEPMTGLDPNQIIEIRSLIKELGKSKAIIFSTHILQEVESICTRFLVLNKGRIASQGLMDKNVNLEEIFKSLAEESPLVIDGDSQNQGETQ